MMLQAVDALPPATARGISVEEPNDAGPASASRSPSTVYRLSRTVLVCGRKRALLSDINEIKLY